jgi:hypothetical protein
MDIRRTVLSKLFVIDEADLRKGLMNLLGKAKVTVADVYS